jgi:putative intracellular protease/amidase
MFSDIAIYDPPHVDHSVRAGAKTATSNLFERPLCAELHIRGTTMNRRQLILSSTALGFAKLATAQSTAVPIPGASSRHRGQRGSGAPLPVPPSGSIPVAFLISDGAVVIDFSGPWEVFESARVVGRRGDAFSVYTVAEAARAVTASGGMRIEPNYTFQNAPAPKVVVIPAQNGAGEPALDWIRRVTKHTDVTMSVCTGAYVLAQTGLLSGKPATTHHGAYADFALQFPEVRLIRGARYVEAGNLATSGGLSSGIDLSLRVVERYFDATWPPKPPAIWSIRARVG